MATLATNGVEAAHIGGALGAAMAQAVRTGAQPVIALRVPVKIARIPDGGDLDITPVPTEFTQDVHDTLGNLGSPDDGMELILGDMESIIDGDALGLDATNQGLADITDTDQAAFAATTWSPIIADHGTFMAGMQTQLDKLANDANLNSFTPPPPNPPPPPPPKGGAGGPPPPPPPPGPPCEGIGANIDGSDNCIL